MNESYFKDLSRIQVMNQEQVAEEMRKHHQGDKNALNRIIEGNLKLVVHIANKYAKIVQEHEVLTLDDLISDGNVGLIEAANKYDPDKQVDFYYYASIWIRKQIIASLLNNLNTIRSPHNKSKSDSKIRKDITALEQELQRDITEQDIEGLGIYNQGELEHFYRKATTQRMPDYFDIEEEEQEQLTGEMLVQLTAALAHLKLGERKLIEAYFGIESEKKSLTQMGKEMNTTKQAIWQKKERALKKLKQILNDK